MVTRLERLLLVCAVRFVAVRAAIIDLVVTLCAYYSKFDVWRYNPSILYVRTFGVRTWRKMALESVSPWLTSL